MTTITIPQEKVKKEGGVVILSLKEYHNLCARAVPTFYLKGKEAKSLDRLIVQGLDEYRSGKTIKASSLREALRIYGK